MDYQSVICNAGHRGGYRMRNVNWQGKQILVLGAARQGLALARYLAAHNSQVTLNDMKTPEHLSQDAQELEQLGVEMVFGSHPLELLNKKDLVCLSGGIPLNLPIVKQALQRNIPLSNDSQIFMELVPCKTIGITGSAGKTTTTTLVGRIAQAGYEKGKVWVGGNIGLPLISLVEQMSANDLVVMELSSFQLEQMTISPDIAAILNVTPNHLDRHGSMQAYITAKSNILLYQSGEDIAVLNRDDEITWEMHDQVQGTVFSFGFEKPAGQYTGTSFHHDWLHYSNGINEEKLLPHEMILIKGRHNLANVLAACAISGAAGLSSDAMINGIAGFTGVPHRLELVRVLQAVAWYNDSIATTPERTMAAINSFQEPIVLLLGGRDKNLPWNTLMELISKRVHQVVLFGEAAPMIQSKFLENAAVMQNCSISIHQTLEEAVQTARTVSNPGDVVLLSPGCTSFDAFTDFEERGEKFRAWVNKLS